MKWLNVIALCVALVESQNPEENQGVHDRNLFEGDMIFTPIQRFRAMHGMDPDGDGTRAAIKSKKKLWPDGILPYEIDKKLSAAQAKKAITQGMNDWKKKTCIRFRKRTNEKDFVKFVPGKTCSSFVGRQGGGQQITLASGCWTKGIVAHEIGHAVGFYHEQSRPDRDKFVKILFENIKDDAKDNFIKFSTKKVTSLGVGYDYGSVMHYRKDAFTKNGKPTIEPTKKGAKIGQRKGLSGPDAKQANKLYNKECSNSCYHTDGKA